MSHRQAKIEAAIAEARRHTNPYRPSSITELTERALTNIWDQSESLKHLLGNAERCRNAGRECMKANDLENAFVFFARSATLVYDYLPTHPEYTVLLSEAQRNNLSVNGKEMVDRLDEIKPILVARFDSWVADHPGITLEEFDKQCRAQEEKQQRSTEEAVRRNQRQAQEVDTRARSEADYRRSHPHYQDTQLDRRKEEVLNSARQAAGTPLLQRGPPSSEHPAPKQSSSQPHVPQNPPSEFVAPRQTQIPASTLRNKASVGFSGPPSIYTAHGSQSTIVVLPEDDTQRKREREEKRRLEQEGIQRRQREAEEAARQVRQTIASNNTHIPGQPVSATPSSSSVTTGKSSPMFLYAQTAPSSLATTPASSFYQQHPSASVGLSSSVPPSTYTGTAVEPPPPPGTILRAPTAVRSRPQSQVFLDQYGGDSISNPLGAELHRTPTRATLRSTNVPPITTTSPPPAEGGPLSFSSLMSPHQQKQGYYPSLDSMFASFDQLAVNGQPEKKNNVMFPSQEANKAAAAAAAAQVGRSMYGEGPDQDARSYGNKKTQGPLVSRATPRAVEPLPHLPMPPPPPEAVAGVRLPVTPSLRHSNQQSPSHSLSHSKPLSHSRSLSYAGDENATKLKTVSIPREVLPRFLAIAKVNTNMNRETCGLLLGREISNEDTMHGHTQDRRVNGRSHSISRMKSSYMVTTLLIPKQRGTSDMCTMLEEELVLKFTMERSLITLGWIHTHPSQSCFMSSVDLHTHSGFQQMLPESFAIVCAPKFTPSFGIFRLRDPRGLETILGCAEREAFHPHPDIPIYTDADKGHVHMTDIPLEIIDLR